MKRLLGKIGQGALILWGVVSLVFFLLMLLPDPTTLAAGQRSDVMSKEAINAEFGLDKPPFQRYVQYLNDLSPIAFHSTENFESKNLSGFRIIPFGSTNLYLKKPYLRRSYQYKKKVSEIVGEALPGTLFLAISALLISSIFGIILGLLAALKQGTWVDRIILILSNVGISFPSFLVAILFAWLFGYILSKYTGLNMYGSMRELSVDGSSYNIQWKNLILPASALAIRIVGIITQLMRSSVISVLNQEYIVTAKAKGLSSLQIIKKHVLKNALNPVVTALSGWFASLLAGAFFVEYVFNWKGLGKVTIEAVQNSDIPVVMGGIIFTACIFIVINILVDYIYAILDPRVKV